MNLLPPTIRAQVRSEYKLRFFALLTLFIFFALCVGIAVSIPFVAPTVQDYFSVKQMSKDAERFEPSEENQKTLTKFQEFNDVLTVLDPERYSEKTAFSDIIRLILSKKPAGISLESFSIFPEEKSKQRIVISGVANNRENLVAFSKNLGTIEEFFEVDLPISNLSKKVDIDFSITMSTYVSEEEEEKDEE